MADRSAESVAPEPDHHVTCVLPLIDQIRILHLGKDDRIFVRVKEAGPEVMQEIQRLFAEHFPENLVYVLDSKVAMSIVRPDSELAELLAEHSDGEVS